MELIAKDQLTSVADNDIRPKSITVSGRFVRRAEIKDEEWLSHNVFGNPCRIISTLKSAPARVDYFTYYQKLPNTTPRDPFPFEWDNVAAINTARFEEWWEGLPQEARKNVRRAGRRGVVIRAFELTDEMIRAILEIYNESPIRQGRPFAHYGKGFETVKQEISTLPETSEFIGAFCGEELIGFIKLVYVDGIASILHIVSKNSHYDKRPANALIAKVAEICRDKGLLFLTYGKYIYGNKLDNPLTEFKRRTGFEKVLVPRYYVPLSLLGRIFLRLKLHRGLIGILPSAVVTVLLKLRSWFVRYVWLPLKIGRGRPLAAGEHSANEKD